MLTVEAYEEIRKAYFVKKWSIRRISREMHHCRRTIRKALEHAEPPGYRQRKVRQKPVLGPYEERIAELVAANESLPPKQRYTARRIFLEIRKEGYAGSEGSVRRYVRQLKGEHSRRAEAFLPLEFSPGEMAQVDWGEAQAVIGGERVKVHLFVMRLNHSRVRFAMVFPFEKQEAFLEGHIQAFRFFGGVPRGITYDNLKTAVYRILEGRNRQEQAAFSAFRSHYLFEARYCTPGQGHEKGGVENDVGYIRRNFLTGLPEAADYAELNARLRQACLDDTRRRLRGQRETIAEQWEAEKATLLPLPAADYRACRSLPVKASPYAQVTFETNRYSVPADYARRPLVLRAFAFRIEILAGDEIIASHPRCFDREQDILDPLHYLDLLRQRPGAFDHALPMRRWRQEWPQVYESLLTRLRERWPEGRGVREFLGVLALHREYPPLRVEAAIREALSLGAAHLDGVRLCLSNQEQPQTAPAPLDLEAHPHLQGLGEQPLDLGQYDRLLSGGPR
jgi:transposase